MFSQKFKSFLRDYFTLTSRERNGALALSCIIIVQCGVLFYLYHTSPPPVQEIKKHTLLIKQFEKSIRESEIVQKNDDQKKKAIRMYHFDPNTITDDEWMRFGLSAKQTSVIRNYLHKGGRFRKKEDVSKMFVISVEQYKRMEPFINIAENANNNEQQKSFEKKRIQKFTRLELNTADTLQLATLPMIGPGRARLIYRYREALGGFVDFSQLYEVYSIDSTVVATIADKISIDKTQIRKLNLNGDEIKHPYLPKKVASVIVAYRKQHGNYSGPDDVKKIRVISDESLQRLAPYLSFE